jgi:hypothetical protein
MRAQMGVFLGKAIHGSGFTPPLSTGIFNDLPVNHWASDWIEQANANGIRAGCRADALMYCPDSPVTRDQVAVFVVRTFGL